MEGGVVNDIEVKKIEQEIELSQQQALALVIKDNESYVKAAELLTAHKNLKKQIENYFKPIKEAAHLAWKKICSRENEELEKLQPAIQYLSSAMVKYNQEQEAARKAEEERLRVEAQKAEAERRLQAAIELEKVGQHAEAEAVLIEPVFMPPPIIKKTVPKIEGQAITTVWRWRLKDINLVPRQYLQVNETAINAIARSLKGNANVPGIEFYPEQTVRGVRT
jgi:tetratricopeptide (TPR) repeat protein